MQHIIAQAETDRLMAHLAQLELLADTRGVRNGGVGRWACLDAALRTSDRGPPNGQSVNVIIVKHSTGN